MNALQAEKAIREVLRDLHLINSEYKSVITMLYTINFLEYDLVKAFINFCYTGILDMTKVGKATS